MRTATLMVLSLLVAASSPTYAQVDSTNAALDELVEEVTEETADGTEDMIAYVTKSVDPINSNLVEIAASNPALSIREGKNGEADTMVMLSDVLFDFGDDELEPEALTVLDSFAAQLEGAPRIRIKGHTDAIGDEESNRILAQQRANNVRDWLVSNTSLTADVIISVGVGEADPIAENVTENGEDNPDGRAQNRRVEFIILDASGRS